MGTAREIAKGKKGFKAKYKKAVRKHGLKVDEDDEYGYIYDERFIYIESFDKMFKIESCEDEYGHTVIERCKLDDGKEGFRFVLSYYNGGGSFDEVFESCYERMIKKESGFEN